MNQDDLSKLLAGVKTGTVEINDALEQLKNFTVKDLGYATIDNHRELRTGYPEVIYGQGKTPEQVAGIVQYMLTRHNNILATRVTPDMVESCQVGAGVPCLFWLSCEMILRPQRGGTL